MRLREALAQHLGAVSGPVARSDDDVLVYDPAKRSHGKDAEGVLDVHADVVDASQQQRYHGCHEKHAPLEVAPQHYRHEACVHQDEARCVPACMHAFY